MRVKTRSGSVLFAAAAVVAAAGQSATNRPASSPAVLRYIPGSTIKLEQLLGEEDKERHQPTLSRTVTRYGLEGTDLGSSFEHDGRVYFLFGDTVGTVARALDSMAATDARDPEAGVRLDFLTAPAESARGGRRGRGRGARTPQGERQYLTIQPSGISMGAFEVPVAGISLSNRMYVVVSTGHTDDRTTDRSIVTRFAPPATFLPGRTMSALPAGRFVKMSLHLEPSPLEGLPPGGPFVLVWGTGKYRESDAYLSVVPASHFEDGQGTRYFAGLNASGSPAWSEREADAVAVARDGTMGDLSVTWCEPLRLWLMTYDTRREPARGIQFSYSRTPWGPWSEPQTIFNLRRDRALGAFVHDPGANPPDRLSGPVIGPGQANPEGVRGGAYAPYVVERWTRLQGNELSIYYVLSTWNPYVVVLMKSRFEIR
jgi:hypothetical protein